MEARSNDRRLIINGIIELSVSEATTFYWVMRVLSMGFVVIACLLAVHRLRHQQRIAFTNTSLILPRSRWSQEERSINYTDISALSVTKINGQQFLNIVHGAGKSAIGASLLPSKKIFNEVCELLEIKIQGAGRV